MISFFQSCNRRVFLAFLLVLCLLLSTSCDEKDANLYKSMVTDVASGGIGVKTERNVWTGMYYEKKDMIDQSCDVLGKTYVGQYRKSIEEKLNSYTTDVYRDSDYIEFGLRSDTKKLVYINFMNNAFYDTEPFLNDVDNPQENAIQLAQEIAEEYVGSISDYEQILEEPRIRYEEKDGKTYQITYYVITFAKKIGGYYTSDYIAIRITSKGNVASIKMGDIGAFNNINIVLDSENAAKSIASKTKEVYSQTGYSVVNFNIVDQKLAITPNQDICLYSRLDVQLCVNPEITIETGLALLTLIS